MPTALRQHLKEKVVIATEIVAVGAVGAAEDGIAEVDVVDLEADLTIPLLRVKAAELRAVSRAVTLVHLLEILLVDPVREAQILLLQRLK